MASLTRMTRLSGDRYLSGHYVISASVGGVLVIFNVHNIRDIAFFIRISDIIASWTMRAGPVSDRPDSRSCIKLHWIGVDMLRPFISFYFLVTAILPYTHHVCCPPYSLRIKWHRLLISPFRVVSIDAEL